MSASGRWKLFGILLLAVVGVAGIGSNQLWNKANVEVTTSVSSTSSLLATTLDTQSTQTTTTIVSTTEPINDSLLRLESSGVGLNIQFAKELRKLPELSNATVEKNVDIKMAEAVQSMVNVVLKADATEQQAISEMLQEGIPEKRKFCTPLQAWLWVAYDYPNYNPLPKYSLNSLLYDAWLGTTTSDRFNSPRWSYAEAKDRVNSPAIVNWFNYLPS